MKCWIRIASLVLFILLAPAASWILQLSWGEPAPTVAGSAETLSVPVKGMVTMVDLGAKACIPCKMMAPIMEKLEKDYRGRAAIIFIDVWKDKEPAQRFGIRSIPTQIFFDKEGREVYRHAGFLSEEAIVSQLKKMGVS